MTGLVGTAHAMPANCDQTQCDAHHAVSSGAAHSDAPSDEANPAHHDDCGLHLCHVLALSARQMDEIAHQSEADLGSRVRHLSTLDEPDGPDKPPNW